MTRISKIDALQEKYKAAEEQIQKGILLLSDVLEGIDDYVSGKSDRWIDSEAGTVWQEARDNVEDIKYRIDEAIGEEADPKDLPDWKKLQEHK